MLRSGFTAADVPARFAFASNPMRVLFLLGAFILANFPACSASFLSSRKAGQHAGTEPQGQSLNGAVLNRTGENLAIAEAAEAQAKASAKATLVHQQGLVAVMATDDAEEAYEKTRPLVPEARAGMTEARLWALKAKRYADHAKQVALATRTITADAAKKAQQAVQDWIQEDADKVAEAAAKHVASTGNGKQKKLEAAVAAAAEPYHLALLRGQKFVIETESKAKSAMKSAQDLKSKADSMAVTASKMQAQRFGLQAQEMMMMAHSTMSEAESMRNWGLKLWNQANDVNQGLGYYQLSEGQAAANAAATFVVNAPPKLPAVAET